MIYSPKRPKLLVNIHIFTRCKNNWLIFHLGEVFCYKNIVNFSEERIPEFHLSVYKLDPWLQLDLYVTKLEG